MKLIGVIVLLGAECVSAADHVPNGTVLYKTPCAKLIFQPVGNPYKAAQEPNTITPPAKAANKRSLCGSKRAVWYVKNGKKKYRCR